MSEENKRVAIAFFQKALNEFDVPTAIALYGGKSYKQHNPLIEDGWEGLTKFVAWLRTNFPKLDWISNMLTRTEILSFCTANGFGPLENEAKPSSIS